jgi:hypothetical protein
MIFAKINRRERTSSRFRLDAGLWLRDDLDQAILPSELAAVRDVAEDL